MQQQGLSTNSKKITKQEKSKNCRIKKKIMEET
jgi:hypothetical protein